MGDLFAGRYELVDPLASGGSGSVWRVWDHRQRTYLAAKVLRQVDSASLMRFMREQSLRVAFANSEGGGTAMTRTGTRRKTWSTLVAATALGIVVGMLAPGAATAATATTEDDDAKLVLVMDASGSMLEADAAGKPRIDAARAALHTVVDSAEGRDIGLRVFGANLPHTDPGTCRDTELLVPIGGGAGQLHQAIDTIQPKGETPIALSLQEAAEDLGDSGQRSIVLVSDGIATCDVDPCPVAAEIAKTGVDVRIDVVGMNVDQAARDQLRCIADAGRGTYTDAEDADSLVQALDTLATRAFQPFAVTGDPVRGGESTDPDVAPVLVPGTAYVDTIPVADQPKYYLIDRKQQGSSIHLGIASYLPGVYDAGTVVSLDTEVTTENGAHCASMSPDNIEAFDNGLVSGVVIVFDDPETTLEDECLAADRLVVEVSSRISEAVGQGGQIIDVSDVPLQLLVEEEPPLEPLDQPLPAGTRDIEPFAELATASDAADGELPYGTSFVDAPLVDAGSYRGSILTGETQMFAVDLDWGQSLRAVVRFDQLGAAERKQVEAAAKTTSVMYNVHGAVFNPLHGRVPAGGAGPEGTKLMSTGLFAVDRANAYSLATSPVRYWNRAVWTQEEAMPAQAGTHYVEISALGLDTFPGSKVEAGELEPFLLDYTVTFEVVGEPSGEPVYAAADVSDPAPTPTGSAPAATDPADASAPTSGLADGPTSDAADAPNIGLIVGLGALGVLLIGGGIAWLMLARARRHRAAKAVARGNAP